MPCLGGRHVTIKHYYYNVRAIIILLLNFLFLDSHNDFAPGIVLILVWYQNRYKIDTVLARFGVPHNLGHSSIPRWHTSMRAARRQGVLGVVLCGIGPSSRVRARAPFVQHLLRGGYKCDLYAFQGGQRRHGRFGTPEKYKTSSWHINGFPDGNSFCCNSVRISLVADDKGQVTIPTYCNGAILLIMPVVTKDRSISPRFSPYEFLSRCKFSTLTPHLVNQ